MAIKITRYVDIVSGVGAGAAVAQRQLIARLFTDNVMLPPQTYIEFNTADEVGSFFGTTSQEYFRALYYFSFLSKNITTPETISFARWVSAAVAPRIYGYKNPAAPQAVGNYTSISTGSFGLTMGAETNNFSGVDFTGASDLAGVAAVLQATIRTGTGTQWTSATVIYNATTGAFQMVGGDPVAAVLEVLPGLTGVDVSTLIGWLPEATMVQGVFVPGAIWANGSAIETITTTLTNSANASNNFGTFAFMPATPLTLTQNIEAANWNKAQNVLFMFSVPVLPSNAATWATTNGTGLGLIGGTGLTLAPDLTFTRTGTISSGVNTVTGLSSIAGMFAGMPVTGTNIPVGTTILTITNATSITLSANATGSVTEVLTFHLLEYPEMLPMAIEAATDYEVANSVQNYMFQQSTLTPSVNDDSTANAMDALRINYYGQTQTAGALLSFYQRGVLMGLPTDPLDMNTYANEQWLKDAATVAVMTLLVSLTRVSANAQGRSQILAILQDVVNRGLNNGTISVNKPLTTAQKVAITQITNDSNAFYQVQNNGYWLNCIIVASGGPVVTYTAEYTLVYSKDDVIRQVQGTHVLI